MKIRGTLLIGLFLSLVVAAAPSSPPSTKATTQEVAADASSAAIAKLFNELSSQQASERDAAFRKLLALRRADLPILRKVVAETGSLQPGVAGPLRAAVVHVYLSEEPYPSTEKGFLGIFMQPINLIYPSSDGDVGRSKAGIMIAECRPGAAGYRYLEPGDIVLEVGGKRGADPTVYLQEIIVNAGAGSEISMKILRRGEVLPVKIRLSRRPLDMDVQLGASIIDPTLLKLGEDYWAREFGPLVPDDVSSGPGGVDDTAPAGP